MARAVQGHEFRIRAARPLPGGTLRTLTRLAPVRSTRGWYLLLWVLPLATLLQVLLRLRAVLEHGAVPDTADALRAPRTTLAPWWVRWFVYPHNMNYHVEDHLYPAIPHYRLPLAHRALAEAGLLE